MDLGSQAATVFGIALLSIHRATHHGSLRRNNLQQHVIQQCVLIDSHHLAIDVDIVAVEAIRRRIVFDDPCLQLTHSLALFVEFRSPIVLQLFDLREGRGKNQLY